MEADIISENEKEINDYKAKAIELERAEQILSRLSQVEHTADSQGAFRGQLSSLEAQYQSRKLQFGQSWAFLSHVGVVSSFSRARCKLAVLNESSAGFRSLVKFLDHDCRLRTTMKIGVVYVGEGQFEQREIFFNDKGSDKYEEMLQSLGKEPGKATKASKHQSEALHYANGVYEVEFHVATRMPTKLNDEQQLEKKKYIGNDSVHVVWDENERAYRPGTITGAFNFAHVIVHPLRNGLFSIRVKRKKDKGESKSCVKFFGPLITGMAIPMNILPVLLRYTAINARRSIADKRLQLYNPLGERKKILERIIADHAMDSELSNGGKSALFDKLIRSNTE